MHVRPYPGRNTMHDDCPVMLYKPLTARYVYPPIRSNTIAWLDGVFKVVLADVEH